ncbi:hypothetical protein F441_23085 [Phytophthora nicotianae CJ01A1]|uniref:Uncharacterized protein n=1 Tax=Phytophthora nicotianae CJ01A1 TaxID=1317063 RepID=W2VMU3_PHYNI|nr:hypothetical protein F441_23085 [Phytophthora nicotianae CJ01A1]
MVICAGSTRLQRRENRKPNRLRQMNPIGLQRAKLRHREALAQIRDPHTDALSSSARHTARCGKRGHPSGRCLFVCRGCGEIHDAGKCQMEKFYNLIRQWYDPAKHGGVLPESAEKMLN